MNVERYHSIALAGALALAALSGAPVLAQPGGGDHEPVTLTLAIADPAGRQSEAAVADLVGRVAQLSDGQLTIIPVYGTGDATDQGFEHGVAELVKAGEFDLGMVGARVWDLAGVTSFQALQAPFLIDDEALALAVARSDAAERALGSMGHGLTGLALWPEHMRYLFSFPPSGRTFRTPQDVAGATVLVFSSPAAQLVTALGGVVYEEGVAGPGSSGDRGSDSDSGALDGMETGLTGVGLPRGDAIVIGDMALYPKYMTLVANDAAMGRLSAEQRTILDQAVSEMEAGAFERVPSEAELAVSHCANGGSVVLAGPDGMADFRSRARPVIEALSVDRFTAELVSDIEAIMSAVTTRSAPPAACSPGALSVSYPASDRTGYLGSLPPEGSYRAELTVEGLTAGGSSRAFAVANAGLTTWAFRRGVATLEATNLDGLHRCTAPMTSVDGEFVRLGESTGNCGITFDFVWRPEPGGISIVLLPPADGSWSLKDFTDFRPSIELVWSRVE